MKKVLILALAFALFAAPAFAVVSGSAHDLSANNWDGNSEICIVCHTPHNATVAVPLWNHTLTTETFTTYTSTTMDAVAGAPTGVSQMCLSCHDGITAMDSFVGSATAATTIGAVAGNFGTDLSDDHPISLTYVDGGTTEMVALATVQADTAITLFGAGNDQVECASCHDVHNNTGFQPFLAKDNAGSALCLSCHAK